MDCKPSVKLLGLETPATFIGEQGSLGLVCEASVEDAALVSRSYATFIEAHNDDARVQSFGQIIWYKKAMNVFL